MSRTAWPLRIVSVAAGAALLIVLFHRGLTRAQNSETAVIEAGSYGSLQEAFEAFPTTGGIVQLPPSRFEIDEP